MQMLLLLALAALVLLPSLHSVTGGNQAPAGLGKAFDLSTEYLPASWPSFDNGNVTYHFNGAFPALTIIEDANSSIRAGLAMEHIFEVVPYTPPVGRPANSGPLGLLARAYASPTENASFHIAVSGDFSAGGDGWANMTNDIAVHSLSGPGLNGLPLWQSPDGEIPVSAIGGTTGSVNVSVSFHIFGRVGTLGQVAISLSVKNWPWIDPASDALALEWQFFAPSVSGAQNLTCSTPLSGGTPSASPCSGGTSLQVGQAVWTNSSVAVESVSQASLLSYLEWPVSGAATAAAGPSVMPLNSALFPISGSNLVRMMQVTKVGAGTVTNFTEDPTMGLLLPPSFASLGQLPLEVRGYVVPLVATVAVTTAAILVIRGVRHRREAERIRDL